MTVIIIPSRPTTKSHEFSGITESGREVNVTVTAAVDINGSAVLGDLRASMPGVSDLKVKVDADPGLFGMMGIMFVLWLVFAFIVFFICLLVGGAGFVDFHEFWPRNLPLVGGERIGVGMFRIWVAAIPFVAIAFPLVLWLCERKDPEGMKVGR